ncbi:hypothetical protein MRB53_015085 [Persea americana]|uniref:Uncharacterized protein n=1 Tax=Persea americana TaxID=3435 RepID=A0ACC2KD67_PERAE|nr:hypothetical protein MRB53_015085 [Persea americana]
MAQAVGMPLASSLSIVTKGENTSISLPKPSSLSFSPSSPNLQGLSILCVRVGGVEIPENKRVEFSLQYIHGIGRSLSRKILNECNIQNKYTKDLSEQELNSIRDEISKTEGQVPKYLIEGELRRFNALAIERLKEIQCYRGLRHIAGLPCRGQRTRNNCRTLKGKRVPIAGKKKAPR